VVGQGPVHCRDQVVCQPQELAQVAESRQVQGHAQAVSVLAGGMVRIPRPINFGIS
jgi:hypothetical protein